MSEFAGKPIREGDAFRNVSPWGKMKEIKITRIWSNSGGRSVLYSVTCRDGTHAEATKKMSRLVLLLVYGKWERI